MQTKLLEVGAYLSGGKVYDASGKEMYFYHVPEWNVGWRWQNRRMKDGEGGNDDRGERGKRARDLNATIEELEQTCHVVRMYIGPGPKD